ncbi:MAG: hypothetical protein AAF702_37655 [Chloroflexota bacterium]
MVLTDTIRNLINEQPLMGADGKWNMAVWIDLRRLDDRQIQAGIQIEKYAQEKKIETYPNIEALAQASVNTVFVAGHNSGLNEGILKDLNEQHDNFKGQFIILNSCGDDLHFRSEIDDIRKKTGASQIFAYHLPIDMVGVRLLFEELTNLVCHDPTLKPSDAINCAIANVTDLIAPN